MEVTITRFRRELFDLVNQAMDGAEVWVTHKGRRFRIAPEKKPASKLSRITPMDVLDESVPASRLLDEMASSWKTDWDKQF